MDGGSCQRGLRALPVRAHEGRPAFQAPPDHTAASATPTGDQLRLRLIKGPRGRGFLQGYNAQAVANEHQIVIAAEVMTAAPDFGHLEPMLDAAQRELEAAGVNEHPTVVIADAGLLASAADGAARRSRHPAADPARQREPKKEPAAGLGRRLLPEFMRRVLAQRAWRRALPPTPADDRARLRPTRSSTVA